MKPLFSRSLAALVLACGIGLPIMAQSPVDIALYRNGNLLDVTVRPGSDFNGIFSAVVFTIRWDASANAALGQLVQEPGPAEYCPIRRSGGLREHNGKNYQVYAGFGLTPMTATPWQAGKEYVIASIPFTGKAEFELVNDPWTSEPVNNANYYLSLGGVDRTGVIYKSLAAADEDAGVTILPNPNDGQFTFTFTNTDAVDTSIELVSALGQSVFSDAVLAHTGTYRRDMDIRSMSAGVYLLKIKRGEETTVHRIVYR
jgi:hypothetical protein